MKKINILFIHLPSLHVKYIAELIKTESVHGFNLSFPLGILYLSSYLKANCGVVGRVAMLDYPLYVKQDISKYETIDDLILQEAKKHIDFEPDIIAFSLMFSASHQFFKIAAQTLRSLYPKSITVVGGIHATNISDFLLDQNCADYVVRGEGEEAFSKMVQLVSENLSIHLEGVYSKDSASPPPRNGMTKFIQVLGSLPFPDWSLLEIDNYLFSDQRRYTNETSDKRMATFITTRGCPYKCSFCSAHTVHGRVMRYRPISDIIEEIRTLYNRYGVNVFVPFDDLFTAKKERVLSLLQSIKILKIPSMELQFPNALHVNTLDNDILDSMIECGVKVFNLAVETGTEYMQKKINKHCDLNKARTIIDYCRKKGMMVRCNFILGFPGETKEMMNESIQYMKTIRPDWYNLYMATPLIGTEMYDQFVEKGYISDCEATWNQTLVQDRAFDTDEISAVDLKQFIDRTNIDLNFLNNNNYLEGKFDRAISLFEDIIKHYPFQIFSYYGMYLSYRGKKTHASAEVFLKKMKDVIGSDQRAADLYNKYDDLLPGNILSEAGFRRVI